MIWTPEQTALNLFCLFFACAVMFVIDADRQMEKRQ